MTAFNKIKKYFFINALTIHFFLFLGLFSFAVLSYAQTAQAQSSSFKAMPSASKVSTEGKGSPKAVPSETGTASGDKGESTEDGSTEDGSTEDGSTEDGSTEDGSTEDGSTEDGSTEGEDNTNPGVSEIISSDGSIYTIDDGNISYISGDGSIYMVNDDGTISYIDENGTFQTIDGPDTLTVGEDGNLQISGADGNTYYVGEDGTFHTQDSNNGNGNGNGNNNGGSGNSGHGNGLFGGFDDARFTVSDIAENMVNTSAHLPALLAALAYLLGLIFGISGIFKLKEHVESPAQNPLRTALVRLLVGGGLFALPIVYESMAALFTGNEEIDFDAGTFSVQGAASSILGIVGGALGEFGMGEDINFILASILNSIKQLPGLVSAGAYLLGLLFGFSALLKLREHVENPDQVSIKEPVIRFAVGGALLALPSVYSAMQNAITGTEGWTIGDTVSTVDGVANIIGDAANCNPITNILGQVWDVITDIFGGISGGGSGGNDQPTDGLGKVICNITVHTGAFPAFLSAIAYLFGLFLGIWGILKIRDHVQNPQQVDIFQGVSRLIAGGCFFSLSFVTETIKTTVAPTTLRDLVGNVVDIVEGIGDIFIDIFSSGNGDANFCAGLDGAFACFITDIMGPMSAALNLFGLVAGTIFIMIGISRLMKTAQDGPKGPGGLGTMVTFIVGGILISYNEILGSFGVSLFGADGLNDSVSALTGSGGITLQYAESGLSEAEAGHIKSTISSVLKFMMIVGWISFLRGVFIVRNVAEGNGQASIMAGVTHMIGGALAVNLGPLMNAVQVTLGIQGFGITFG